MTTPGLSISDATREGPRIDPGLLDCVVIGGGPAGLCAATYLARFRRDVLVIDSGESRLLRVPLARNVPGYPDGISGKALHAQQMAQAGRYGARIERGRVTHITRAAEGFEITAAHATFRARAVILATGVKLVEPEIADLDRAVAETRLRYCPVCDGFETQNKRVAVLGRHADALNEARFLRRYTDQVTFLCESEQAKGDVDLIATAEREGVVVLRTRVQKLALASNGIEAALVNGERHVFDALYPCLGAHTQTELVRKFAVSLAKAGGVLADEHQRTGEQGIYAIGDVREGLDQIASAWGQAAIAATAIHNDLRLAESGVAVRDKEPRASCL